MQKKLIAAAVAGLIAVPALAQTNVTISGNFRAGWESYKLSGGVATGHDRESRVSDQSSGLRFNVVEDLGGGLKAWGQLDYRGALDLGTLGNTGNSGVGFMHNTWGKFTIGRWDVHYNEFGAIESNRAGSLQTFAGNGMMSQVASISTAAGELGTKAFNRTEVLSSMANATRTPNILMWDSPNWNGFTARLAYSSGYLAGVNNEGTTNRAVGDSGSGRAWTGALRYNNGPWVAGVSYWNANSENRSAATPQAGFFNPITGAFTAAAGARMHDQRSTRAWLGYTFAMGLKVGLGWDRSSLDNGYAGMPNIVGRGKAARSAWMVPVSYTFGPHAIYGTYARAGSASGSAIAAGTGGDYKAHQWTVGYDYAFSKRTSMGVFYTKVNNNMNAAGTAGGSYDMFALGVNGATTTRRGEDASQLYIGMNHSF